MSLNVVFLYFPPIIKYLLDYDFVTTMLRILTSLTPFLLAVVAQAESDDSESLVTKLLTAGTQIERINDIKVC